MWFYPERYPIKPRSGPRIVAIEPNRVLLLCHQVTDDATTCPGTWQFVLEASGANATRLMLRARSGTSPTTWFDILAEPAYFLMTRGVMLGIKRRAEMSSADQGASGIPTAGRTKSASERKIGRLPGRDSARQGASASFGRVGWPASKIGGSG
jgi:hypothetical protein